MLDEHWERIYPDLLRFFNFDLEAWVTRRREGAVGSIQCLIEALPDESLYSQWATAEKAREQAENGEWPPSAGGEMSVEEKAVIDATMWTPDRILIAELIRAVDRLLGVEFAKSGQAGEYRPAEVGPYAWREKIKGRAKNDYEPPKTASDLFGKLGI